MLSNVAAMTRIWDVYQTGDLQEAMSLASAALEEAENDGRLWELRGLIHRDRGEPIQCADALERASLLVPLKPLARIRLAEAYGQLQRRVLARDLYVELLGDELAVELLLEVAIGLDALDYPAFAMHACRKAIEREPEQARPYFDLGYYAARCGYPPHVVESLARKAVALAPDCVKYRVALATLLLKQQQLDQAHAVVRAITPEQLDQLACRCCLERLVLIFDRAGEAQLAAAGRERLARLPIRDNNSGCN